MLRAQGNFDGGPGHIDVSFRAPERWTGPTALQATSRVADTPMHATAITLGDDEAGPVLIFLRLAPGVTPPDAPAHGHASDNWRISLLGSLPMGREAYGPGEFRIQEGWKPYASDNYALGPDGGWSALLFADRRGVRMRHVKAQETELTESNRHLAEWLGIKGDLVSDSPDDAPGPSRLVTSLDDARRAAHINSSFAEADGWLPVGADSRFAAALMGDPARGPVLVLTRTAPGGQALSGCSFDTEGFRMVVRGSHTIDGTVYEIGDMRVDSPEARYGDVIAGDDGVDEVILVADRRAAMPLAGAGPWADALQAEVARLLAVGQA
ncbi:MAG TPA: hypothetical protein VHL53_06315 [Acidimicrobiia bacterium]|nr:hypothetical protein [Acidimicrobiia bacterium]